MTTELTSSILSSISQERERIFGIVVSMSDCHPRGPGSIPGYTPEIFQEVYGLDRDPLSLVRTIG